MGRLFLCRSGWRPGLGDDRENLVTVLFDAGLTESFDRRELVARLWRFPRQLDQPGIVRDDVGRHLIAFGAISAPLLKPLQNRDFGG
jgi:hypothetical protein